MKKVELNPRFSKIAEDHAASKLNSKSLSLVPMSEIATKDDVFTLMAAINAEKPNSESISFAINKDGKVFSEAELAKTFKRNIFIPEKLDLVIPRFDKPSISPNLNDLVLNLCDKFGERLMVHIPKNPIRDVDVYFLADTTGSMGASLNTVQTNIASIITTISGVAGINAAFGAGNYKDFPNDSYCFKHDVNITTNSASVIAGVNTWSSSGGSDGSEGQLFALTKIADGSVPVGWRPNSLQIIVWFGDYPGHDPICPVMNPAQVTSMITEANTTTKLVSAKVRVLAVSVVSGPGLDANPNTDAFDYSSKGCAPAGAAGQATRITTATSGAIQSGVVAADIANKIIDIIQTSISTIHNVSLVPTGTIQQFICSINPKNGYNNLDAKVPHDLEFIVCFRGVVPCNKEKDQRFKGTIDVVMDGVVVAQKIVLIEVPSCRSKGKCQCNCCD
jgi:hypothetical protein